jgi:hypothetical protein
MMSTPLERAKRDLAQKEETIQALKAEADRIRGFIEMYPHYAEGGAVTGLNGGGPRSKKEIVTATAEKIIRERHSPVSLGDLHDTIRARGVMIGTQNPRQALSQILNRDPRFKSTDKGWTMVNWKDEGLEADSSEPFEEHELGRG